VRRPEEVLVVVFRRGRGGPEFLVLERSPERQGYWHLVAGALEWEEDAAAAAARELREETGLDADVSELAFRFHYPVSQEPPARRAQFGSGIEQIAVAVFSAEAPASWEPELDDEHVSYRWCSADDAIELLFYPEPKDAVRLVAESLAGATS
jgi:8-oxo-dGTP pyrophosphatase MutT (NUDIX family)